MSGVTSSGRSGGRLPLLASASVRGRHPYKAAAVDELRTRAVRLATTDPATVAASPWLPGRSRAGDRIDVVDRHRAALDHSSELPCASLTAHSVRDPHPDWGCGSLVHGAVDPAGRTEGVPEESSAITIRHSQPVRTPVSVSLHRTAGHLCSAFAQSPIASCATARGWLRSRSRSSTAQYRAGTCAAVTPECAVRAHSDCAAELRSTVGALSRQLRTPSTGTRLVFQRAPAASADSSSAGFEAPQRLTARAAVRRPVRVLPGRESAYRNAYRSVELPGHSPIKRTYDQEHATVAQGLVRVSPCRYRLPVRVLAGAAKDVRTAHSRPVRAAQYPVRNAPQSAVRSGSRGRAGVLRNSRDCAAQ